MGKGAKNAAVWLGPGEFSHRDDYFGVQREARRIFLKAIEDKAPQVLAELAQEPLTLFRPLWEQTLAAMSEVQRRNAHSHLAWNEALHWHRFKGAGSTQDPDAAEFRERLTAWAKRWNLDQSADDWMLVRAVDTLLEWCEFPNLFERDGPKWATDLRSTMLEFSDAEMALVLPCCTWNPQRERKTEARKRILKDLRDQVSAELKRIENFAKGRLERTPERKSGNAHFRWLVAYQVLELDWADVAKRAKRSTKQVRAASRIARLVGIRLRKGRPPGRPRTRPLQESRPKRGTGSRLLRRDRPTAPSPEN